MRRILCAAFLALLAMANASEAGDAPLGAPLVGCEETDGRSTAVHESVTAPIQLAQRGCRGECSARRSYCLSSCSGRSQCGAICNDNYQSCLASCR